MQMMRISQIFNPFAARSAEVSLGWWRRQTPENNAILPVCLCSLTLSLATTIGLFVSDMVIHKNAATVPMTPIKIGCVKLLSAT